MMVVTTMQHVPMVTDPTHANVILDSPEMDSLVQVCSINGEHAYPTKFDTAFRHLSVILTFGYDNNFCLTAISQA